MKRYRSHIVYFLYWMIFFVLTRGVFLLYQHSRSASLSFSEIVKVFRYGSNLDASFTGYICIFPFLYFFIRELFPKLFLNSIIRIYTIIVIVLLSFIAIADLELYNAWGFRMDATPLRYFSHLKEMAASAGSAPVLLLLLLLAALIFLFTWLYIRICEKYIKVNAIKREPLHIFISLLLLFILFIPIRGGLQQIPINQSDVYFSNKPFANHAALNLPWNIMHSLLNSNIEKKNPYVYFSEKIAKDQVDSLYKHSSEPASILTIQHPNIIFIILESYTAKYIGCLGGEPGVTPNIDKIAQEGLLFTNIYSTGDRSEKGLVGLLSGYPTQPTTSIIFDASKTQKLPHLDLDLKKNGYHSGYYYGGEIEFANIKSYLLNAGYDKLITKKDFPDSDYNSKWGVHDHILLERFSEDLSKEHAPFFMTLFTLSSHEPFEIPIPKKFEGNDQATQFKNSFYYTDQSIGNFIEWSKKESWWDSTLIILVADHGSTHPGNDPNYKSSKFHIPLILTGGALKTKNVINNNIGSQTDVAVTLLQQMGLPDNKFLWSKNLLDPEAKQFAFYVFNDGFGWVTPAGWFAFDNISKTVIYKDPGVSEEQVNNGKAYMQMSYQDFLDR